MTQARYRQICLGETSYYHCSSQCVSNAYLCGNDPASIKNYDHRRKWMTDKLAQLSRMFAIKVCSYAILHNRYSLVVCVNQNVAKSLSDQDVVARWSICFKVPQVVKSVLEGKSINNEDYIKAHCLIDTWRHRLSDLSWFMRLLNECIARRANSEDGCKGKFWKGRYKSQALLDDAALIACMSYIDMLPECSRQESMGDTQGVSSLSYHTCGIKKPERSEPLKLQLAPFKRNNESFSLPCTYHEYKNLIIWTKQALITKRKWYVPGQCRTFLNNIGINANIWLDFVSHYHRFFNQAVGSYGNMRKLSVKQGKRHLRGMLAAKKLYLNVGI